MTPGSSSVRAVIVAYKPLCSPGLIPGLDPSESGWLESSNHLPSVPRHGRLSIDKKIGACLTSPPPGANKNRPPKTAACFVNQERLKRFRPVTAFTLLEQRQVDAVPHVHVAEVAGVQMVAGIILRKHFSGVARVGQALVKVDHPVEGAARADPMVDVL